MQVLKRPLLAMTIAVISGCVSTGQVSKMGPDTYRVSASSLNLPNAESSVLGKAQLFCEQQKKELLVTNTVQDYQRPHHTYSVTFRCLTSDDPSLQRPTYQQAPTTVIEDRRR